MYQLCITRSLRYKNLMFHNFCLLWHLEYFIFYIQNQMQAVKFFLCIFIDSTSGNYSVYFLTNFLLTGQQITHWRGGSKRNANQRCTSLAPPSHSETSCPTKAVHRYMIILHNFHISLAVFSHFSNFVIQFHREVWFLVSYIFLWLVNLVSITSFYLLQYVNFLWKNTCSSVYILVMCWTM